MCAYVCVCVCVHISMRNADMFYFGNLASGDSVPEKVYFPVYMSVVSRSLSYRLRHWFFSTTDPTYKCYYISLSDIQLNHILVI